MKIILNIQINVSILKIVTGIHYIYIYNLKRFESQNCFWNSLFNYLNLKFYIQF